MAARFVPTTSEDVEMLLTLMHEYYRYDQHPYDEAKARRGLTGLLANPAYGLAWLIEVDGALAGYTVICFGYSLEFGGRDAFIDELYLRESYRGQGIGRQAIDHLLAVCHDNDVRALHLEVENQNMDAHAFYQKTGFEEHASRFMSRYIKP